MRFDLPPSLLQKLRQHREQGREHCARVAAEARKHAPEPSPAQKPKNYLDSVERMFSGETGDVRDSARAYVNQMGDWQSEVEDAYDAFLLDPGMGPMVYITADGRLLSDARGWDGEEISEVEDKYAIIYLVVGAKKTGVTELLELIPKPPAGASTCPECAGSHWSEPLPGTDFALPCGRCNAHGWIVPDSPTP